MIKSSHSVHRVARQMSDPTPARDSPVRQTTHLLLFFFVSSYLQLSSGGVDSPDSRRHRRLHPPPARATARDSILTAPLQPWLPLVRPVGPFVCFRFSSLDHQCYTSCFVAAVCSSESQVDFRVLSTLILFLFLRIMEKENHFSLCIQLVRRTPPPIYLQSYYESSCCFM